MSTSLDLASTSRNVEVGICVGIFVADRSAQILQIVRYLRCTAWGYPFIYKLPKCWLADLHIEIIKESWPP